MTPRGVDLRKQFLSRLNHTFTGVGSRGLPITASFPNLDTIWSKPWRTLRSPDIKPASTSGFCTFVNQISYVLEVLILDEIWRHTWPFKWQLCLVNPIKLNRQLSATEITTTCVKNAQWLGGAFTAVVFSYRCTVRSLAVHRSDWEGERTLVDAIMRDRHHLTPYLPITCGSLDIASGGPTWQLNVRRVMTCSSRPGQNIKYVSFDAFSLVISPAYTLTWRVLPFVLNVLCIGVPSH